MQYFWARAREAPCWCLACFPRDWTLREPRNEDDDCYSVVPLRYGANADVYCPTTNVALRFGTCPPVLISVTTFTSAMSTTATLLFPETEM